MYLKRLTLRGFKSFASATTMAFEPGITAIVGPNGSGKSNVVDALAWVMGEQGPKHLRGGSMEDVIFAGTKERPALGRAEVVLIIDNADQALPIDYTEVTIARTKFRNGASEYAINGTPCRLLDVRELLSDTGLGRQMHVIVGQGQLDLVLQATPETRRGLIEEAAGVLKHRERKEKALRKLESTEANLHRLDDLVTEIRRQLKPLGRQAEVARRAGVIQADLRDAKARLLADDVASAVAELEAELASEASVAAQRTQAEAELAQARSDEERAGRQLTAASARLALAQETRYALSGQAEQVRSTISLAGERLRRAELEPAPAATGRDPDTLDAQAAETLQAEVALRAEIEAGQQALRAASARRQEAERADEAATAAYAARLRAEADRREGLARLAGQAASLRSRQEAAAEQVARLRSAIGLARDRGLAAQAELDGLDGDTDGLDEAVASLTRGLAQATMSAESAEQAVAVGEVRLRQAAERRAGLVARSEALRLTVDPADAAQTLADAGATLGPATSVLHVEKGWEVALAAALGPAVEAGAVPDVAAAFAAMERMTADDLGRAGLMVAGAPADDRADWPKSPGGMALRWAADCVITGPRWRPAVDRLLRGVVVVDGLAEARRVVEAEPRLTVVTRAGDIVSRWFAVGGSAAKPSALQIQAALDETLAELEEATEQVATEETGLAESRRRRDAAVAEVAMARRALEEAREKATAAARRRELLQQTAASADGEAARLEQQAAELEAARERDRGRLAELTARLERAQAGAEGDAGDGEDVRDEAAEAAREARRAETEARLALRTVEERVRSLAGRAESLRQAARSEREARARAAAARARIVAEAAQAGVVVTAAEWLVGRVEASLRRAEADRVAAQADCDAADQAARAARQSARTLAGQLEVLIDSAHKDELARAQQAMRLDALADRAEEEVGLDIEALLAGYGPTVPIPLGSDTGEAGEGVNEPLTYPYVRDEQLKRLRAAERDLQVLGRVNPLALEEFDALQERHRYLAGQLDDIRQTRHDLKEIVADVDARVERVFAEAYADVEREFAVTFARLFPGGEGRLILTEPGQWLTTGVDVEARPAGKTVRRLSLLSGGERSLVAVCFLIALFKARPSPFYILDEVEAALDDTNLGRLLDVYDELRHHSQLLLITHQKRTMEIADVLYGVSMKDNGISTVVSQRLRQD